MTFDLEGIAYTFVLAGRLLPHGLLVMNLCEKHIWAVPAIGMAVTYMLLREGAYWSIFPHGKGFWTLNRTTAGILYIAAFCAPLGWHLVRWHLLGGRARQEARIQQLRER